LIQLSSFPLQFHRRISTCIHVFNKCSSILKITFQSDYNFLNPYSSILVCGTYIDNKNNYWKIAFVAICFSCRMKMPRLSKTTQCMERYVLLHLFYTDWRTKNRPAV